MSTIAVNQWLHPDSALTTSVGVTFAARYIGNLAILSSMKALDFEARSLLTRESIARVCAAAAVPLKSRVLNFASIKPQLATMLSDVPNLVHGGTGVTLSITTTHLTLINIANSSILLQHELSKVSFSLANGGEQGSSDTYYAAYVVNDGNKRICVILDCGLRAPEVANTIGQAFAVLSQRIRSLIPVDASTPCSPKSPSSVLPEHEPPSPMSITNSTIPSAPPLQIAQTGVKVHTYYNDLGGKIAPPVDFALYRQVTGNLDCWTPNINPWTCDPLSPIAEETHLSMETTPLATSQSIDITFVRHQTPDPNCSDGSFESLSVDVPNEISLSRPINRSNGFSNLYKACHQSYEEDTALECEPWYHGSISRHYAEALMQRNGQFLVRLTSHPSSIQRYVLTTRQLNCNRHILLQQKEGFVCCEGQYFESVSHMMRFYREHNMALVTTNGELLWLKLPVNRS